MPTKPKKRAADRHLSKFMVRLPEAYRIKLEELAEKLFISPTKQVRRALDIWFEENQ